MVDSVPQNVLLLYFFDYFNVIKEYAMKLDFIIFQTQFTVCNSMDF